MAILFALLAVQVPYKEEFADLIHYQQVQLQRAGVEVVRFETDEQGQTTVVARPWPHQEGAPELCFLAETVIIGMGLRADHSLADALADRLDVYTSLTQARAGRSSSAQNADCHPLGACKRAVLC